MPTQQKVLIPIPGDDFVSWANNLANQFTTSFVPVATDVSLWREWAINFLASNPNFVTYPVPTEDLYPNIEDWEKWAAYLCNNYYTL